MPIATELAMFAFAFGPIATLFSPVAWLSASVEFAWKYLMPFALILSIGGADVLVGGGRAVVVVGDVRR